MKSSNLIIDTVAFVGKSEVENSSLSEIKKEFAKIGIDLGKELFKEFTQTPKEKILDYAKLCDIKKFIFFTYKLNNIYFTLTFVEGSNITGFCNLLGARLFTAHDTAIIEDCINNNIFILCGKEEFFID